MSEFTPVLDVGDAAMIVKTLYCLADLIEQPPYSPAYLSDNHLKVLTSPPGHAIYRDRPQFAAMMRYRAGLIEDQLTDDAPRTDGPYAFHTEHPPRNEFIPE